MSNAAALIEQERNRRYGGADRLRVIQTRLKRKMFEKEFASFGGSADEFAKLKGISTSDPVMAGIVEADKMKQGQASQGVLDQLRQAQTRNYDKPSAPPTASATALLNQYKTMGPNMGQEGLGNLSGLMEKAGLGTIPKTNLQQNPLVASRDAGPDTFIRPKSEPKTMADMKAYLLSQMSEPERKDKLFPPDIPTKPTGGLTETSVTKAFNDFALYGSGNEDPVVYGGKLYDRYLQKRKSGMEREDAYNEVLKEESSGGKELTPEIAEQIFQEAGGDAERATQIAKESGYDIPESF